MREMIVQANLCRGESKRVSGELDEAEAFLNLAASEAEAIGRVRLLWDIHAALARLHAQKGQNDLAQKHKAKGKALVSNVAADLTDPNLCVGLPRFN